MILGLFTGLTSPGGVQYAGRQTAAALAAWARSRNVPYCFLSLNDLSGEQEFPLGEQTIRFRGFARSKGSFIGAVLRSGWDAPSIIVAAHPHLVPAAIALKKIARHASILAMCHGIEVWQPLSTIRRNALRKADHVTAPSSDTADKLAGIQEVRPERITRLPWSLDSGFCALATSSRDLPRPAGFPDGTVVLTVGRWDRSERYKGLDHLIQAIASLQPRHTNLHLVAIGSGDDLPRMRDLAREAGIADRAHFLQDLSREQIASCYSRCTVFALPSGGEGFGFVFLEAMAFGKAVIGGAHGGTPDVIENGKTGLLVPHGNVAQLSTVLTRLLTDDDLRNGMGNHGREVVKHKFLFPRFQSDLERLLERTCAS